METILYYLLRASIAATVFYVFYKLILSKRTFHTINRIVILSIVGLTLLLPLFTLHLPEINRTESSVGMISTSPLMENISVQTKMTAIIENPRVEIPWMQVIMLFYVTGVGLVLFR